MTTPAPDAPHRREEIARNLDAVRERIASACAASGRSADEVGLTVVTKLFPPKDVRVLAELGVHDVGENRHQEAVEKAAQLEDLDLRWHFVGNLQSNKAAAVAGYADVVESVDRPKLVAGLARGAARRGVTVDCLVQVNLDPPEAPRGRGGARQGDVVPLAEAVAGTEGLRLRGVMTVAPPGLDPAPVFARLAEIAASVRAVAADATWISAGMSGDLEAAIEAGATHVRIGSAVLGRRPGIK